MKKRRGSLARSLACLAKRQSRMSLPKTALAFTARASKGKTREKANYKRRENERERERERGREGEREKERKFLHAKKSK